MGGAMYVSTLAPRQNQTLVDAERHRETARLLTEFSFLPCTLQDTRPDVPIRRLLGYELTTGDNQSIVQCFFFFPLSTLRIEIQAV